MDADLKRKINNLTALKLEEARAYISLRLQNGVAKAGKKNDDAMQLCLELMAKVMEDRGTGTMSWSALTTGPGFDAFKTKFQVEGLGEWLAREMKTKIELRSFVRLGCNLLADELEDAGYSVTARTLQRHFHRLPSVINRAFPGYAISGNLHLIIRAEKKHVREE